MAFMKNLTSSSTTKFSDQTGTVTMTLSLLHGASWHCSGLTRCYVPSEREVTGYIRNEAFLISPVPNRQHILRLKMNLPSVCPNHVSLFYKLKSSQLHILIPNSD